MGLSKKRIKTLMDRVQVERQRIIEDFDHVLDEKYTLDNDDRSDSIDQATSDYERSQMLRFRNRDSFYKKKLDKALVKFKNDEYGICEECDEDIKFERLFARPTAELCISCKDEAERAEQGNFIGRQSKSLEKRAFQKAV